MVNGRVRSAAGVVNVAVVEEGAAEGGGEELYALSREEREVRRRRVGERESCRVVASVGPSVEEAGAPDAAAAAAATECVACSPPRASCAGCTKGEEVMVMERRL
jgi:hypothetical protein